MYDKTQLTYETYQTHSHGYGQTHVVVREMYVEDTAAHLEGTVDNKAGYGTVSAAEQQGRRFRAMLEAGHEVHFDHTTCGLVVHLRWQHYEVVDGRQTYCSVTYEDMGRSFGQHEKAMKFLRELGRRVQKTRGQHRGHVTDHDFSTPQVVLEVLASMRKMTAVRRDFDAWVLDTNSVKVAA